MGEGDLLEHAGGLVCLADYLVDDAVAARAQLLPDFVVAQTIAHSEFKQYCTPHIH